MIIWREIAAGLYGVKRHPTSNFPQGDVVSSISSNIECKFLTGMSTLILKNELIS